MSNIRFLVDLTTSRGYKGQNAVGIVRTEREIAKAYLSSGLDVAFFYFASEADRFIIIPDYEAAAIVGMLYSGGSLKDNRRVARDGDTQTELSSSVLTLPDRMRFLEEIEEEFRAARQSTSSNADRNAQVDLPLEFFDGDVVISAGILWDGNFLEVIFAQQQKIDLRLIQILYDIVPVIIPEFCVPGMNIRFPKFLLDAAWTADAFYCISQSTLVDVEAYLKSEELPAPVTRRIQLGADIVQQSSEYSALSKTLEPGKFVVYVSTIEPRKNHITLFHVWRQLLVMSPDILVPLVIVGRQGWNSGDLINMIQGAEQLHPEYIKLLTDVSDADLDWLYRNASFSVYPSLYEGWGLPVAESLARGKFCLVSSSSSMPEVAEGFAELLDPLDLQSWTERIRYFLLNPHEVLAREKCLATGYTQVPWSTAMARFIASVCEVLEVSPKPHSLERV